MQFRRLWLAALPLLALLAACDTKPTESSDSTVALVPGKTAASFQLEAVVALVEGDTIADAKTLEAKINDPAAKLNAVDLDEDGVTDVIDVIERREGDTTVLELRAIPSSKQDQPLAKVSVVIATIELHVEQKVIIVDANYSEHIEHDAEVHVYHHEHPAVYEDGVLVVSSGCFFHYVFVLDHDLYLGHHHIIVIIDTHDHVYKKHKKHKKPKKHKGHGHGHGVIVNW